MMSGVGSQLKKGASKMAKPNYSYEKRQRELAKKQKKAEKEKRKSAPPQPVAPEPGSEPQQHQL
jgi:hypothetical protein